MFLKATSTALYPVSMSVASTGVNNWLPWQPVLC